MTSNEEEEKDCLWEKIINNDVSTLHNRYDFQIAAWFVSKSNV